MAVTLADHWDSYRWIMQEKGLQKYWNEMKQVINSVLGVSLVAGTTVIGAIDLTAENAAGLKSVSTTRSGSFSTSNAGLAGSSVTLLPDPAGQSGAANQPPTPNRSNFRTPSAGFRS